MAPRTINNYRHREGLKPFHAIPKPLKTETHISDRLWLCDWLKDWTKEDFLHLAPADEFYVWIVRSPNYQNDRIWARSIEDIEEDEGIVKWANIKHALEFSSCSLARDYSVWPKIKVNLGLVNIFEMLLRAYQKYWQWHFNTVK